MALQNMYEEYCGGSFGSLKATCLLIDTFMLTISEYFSFFLSCKLHIRFCGGFYFVILFMFYTDLLGFTGYFRLSCYVYAVKLIEI